MPEMKTVSILSPVFNGERYIGKYLESVLRQTYPKIELIVIDDGSTDGTAQAIQACRERFARRGYTLIYKKQPENKGQAAAINVGLKLFTGEYMMWMDADDIFYPDAIEKKARFLDAHPEFGFVLSEGEIVSPEDLDNPIRPLRRIEPTGMDCLFQDLLDENNVVFVPGSIFVRSSSLRSVLPDLTIYESREGQNWQLMLPLAYGCKWGYLKEVLFKCVANPDSHSRQRRTCRQEYERRENFDILLQNTIDKILGMSEEERKYWKKYAHVQMLQKQHPMCVWNKMYAQGRNVERELRRCGVIIPWKERYWAVCVRLAARRLVEKTHGEKLYRFLRGKSD